MSDRDPHDELLELAELYALGGLSPQDRARVEEHVADGCERCAAALRANVDVADQLLLAIGPVAPSAAVRDRLFARVRAEQREVVRLAPGQRPRASRLALVSRLAAALAIVGLGALSGALGVRLSGERKLRGELEVALAHEQSVAQTLQREVAAEREQRIAMEQRVEGMSRIVAAFEAPLTRTLALAGQGVYAQAVARAYLDPESGRLILYAHNLPPVPDGRTYQLWVIVENRPTSVGIFRSDSQGEAKYDSGRIPDLDGPVTVAVTLEPDGGVPQPTGPIVLAGS